MNLKTKIRNNIWIVLINWCSAIDTLNWFSDLIEKYQARSEILDTLTADQVVALFNIIGYFMILQTLISRYALGFIFAGEIFIKKFNLESRYPRLSKFLKARAKLSKASLWLHIIVLFSITLILLGVNVSMFYYRYTFA